MWIERCLVLPDEVCKTIIAFYMNEQGYTFLEGLLSTDQIAQAIAVLDATYG